MLLALLLSFLPVAAPAVGLLLLVAGFLIVVRAARWKLWHCRNRPDLLVLALGYLWLAAGAGASGLSLLKENDPVASMQAVDNDKLHSVAGEVRSMLETVVMAI